MRLVTLSAAFIVLCINPTSAIASAVAPDWSLVSFTGETIRLDLRKLPMQDPPSNAKESTSHRKKAAHRAPYRAAEIRNSIDAIRDAATQ